MKLPVIYGFTNNEISSQWTCFFIMAPVVIGFALWIGDRKSTRLNSSHTVIYTLSLHDALPIYETAGHLRVHQQRNLQSMDLLFYHGARRDRLRPLDRRSEEHTSELQSHRDLHSFPTRRSSDL